MSNEIDPNRIFGGREMIITQEINGQEPVGKILVYTVVGLSDRDGAFFVLQKGQMTNAVKIVGDCVVQEEVVHGEAWLIRIFTDGKISCELRGIEDGYVSFEKGEVGIWVAADKETVIENITAPVFNPEMEKVIEFEDTTVDPRFWELMVEPKEVIYYPEN